MAYFNVEFAENFTKQLSKLGENTESIVEEMLDEAAQIMQDELEKEIRSKHHATGELEESIDTKVYMNDWYAWAYPEGRSSKLMRKGKIYKRSKHGTKSSGRALYNTDKLWWIEHGRAGQPARPFMDRLTKNIEGTIAQKLQKIIDREVGL